MVSAGEYRFKRRKPNSRSPLNQEVKSLILASPAGLSFGPEPPKFHAGFTSYFLALFFASHWGRCHNLNLDRK